MMPTISVEQALERGYEPHNLQTILFDKKKWNRSTSTAWLKKHGYSAKYYRETIGQIRRMQHNPVETSEYYSKTLPRGITFVFQKFDGPLSESEDGGRLPAGELPKSHYKAQLRQLKQSNECCKPYSYLTREQLKARVERLGAPQQTPLAPEPRAKPRAQQTPSAVEPQQTQIAAEIVIATPKRMSSAKFAKLIADYESFKRELPSKGEIEQAHADDQFHRELTAHVKSVITNFLQFDRANLEKDLPARMSERKREKFAKIRKRLEAKMLKAFNNLSAN